VGRSGAARPGLAGVRGETAASRGTPESGSAAAAAPPQREKEAARRRRKAKPSPELGERRDLEFWTLLGLVRSGSLRARGSRAEPRSVNKMDGSDSIALKLERDELFGHPI